MAHGVHYNPMVASTMEDLDDTVGISECTFVCRDRWTIQLYVNVRGISCPIITIH